MPFGNPIVGAGELIVPGIRSQNFLEGERGWRVTRDGNAQFGSLAAVDTLGADILTADTDITVADTSILDMLDQRPVGILAFGQMAGGVDTADIGGTEVGCYQMNWGPVTPEHFYIISILFFITRTVAAEAFQFRHRRELNLTQPTVASSTMAGSLFRIPGGSTATRGVYYQFIYAPGTAQDSINMLLTMQRVAGAGTAAISHPSNDQALQWTVIDGGLRADVGGGISQKSKASGTADPTPTTTYKKKYYGSWSRTFDGDNSVTWDDSDYCYQGYYSSDRGNTRSLVGFDYAQIMSDLSGATVTSCKLTFRCAHSYYNAGLSAQIGTHDYSAKPGSWDGSRVDERRTSVAGVTAGETITKELGTGIGAEFKSGASRGIAFGPGPSTSRDYYGFFYGADQGGQPYLTITYRK